MASNELASAVASLESRAEIILKEAKARAAEILGEANREAARIDAERPSLDGITAECTAVVEKARDQARKMVQESAQQADLIKAHTRSDGGKAFKAIVHTIEGMVRGER